MDFQKSSDVLTEAILKYYCCMVQNMSPPPLMEWEAKDIGAFFGATVACELRHIDTKCSHILSQGEPIVEWLADNIRDCFSNDNERLPVARKFINYIKENDDSLDYLSWFLEKSAYLFAGSWVTGYGGRSWASCCIHASNFLKELMENNGRASVMGWERWLNSFHNNGKWLSKLGNAYIVKKAMGLGAERSPKEILEISKEFFLGNTCPLRALDESYDQTFFKEVNIEGELISLPETLKKYGYIVYDDYEEEEYIDDEEENTDDEEDNEEEEKKYEKCSELLAELFSTENKYSAQQTSCRI